MSVNSLLCHVNGCPNNRRYVMDFPNISRNVAKSNIVYYSVLPKWTDILRWRINVNIPLEKALICSEHFEKRYFTANSKTLRKDAVPSIFCYVEESRVEEPEPPNKKFKASSSNADEDLTDSEDQTSQEDGEEEEFVEEWLEYDDDDGNEGPSNKSNSPEFNTEEESSHNSEELNPEEEPSHNEEFKSIEQEMLRATTANIERLKTIKMDLERDLQNLWKIDLKLSAEIQEFTESMEQKKPPENHIGEAMQLLKKCFSPAQIKILLGKRHKHFTPDDIAMADTIVALTSRRFYNYLRTELKYPLPGLASLFRLTHNKRSG